MESCAGRAEAAPARRSRRWDSTVLASVKVISAALPRGFLNAAALQSIHASILLFCDAQALGFGDLVGQMLHLLEEKEPPKRPSVTRSSHRYHSVGCGCVF